MFQRAYEVASGLTRPVVMSRLTADGKCSAGIGALVMINKDGWFVTANHLIDQASKLLAGEAKAREHEKKVAEIRDDGTLSNKDKSRMLAGLGKIGKDETVRSSIWWGQDGLAPEEKFFANPLADVAVGRFKNFDPTTVLAFPKFKDPSKGIEPGKSLCKLGFPFHSIVPSYDSGTNNFSF